MVSQKKVVMALALAAAVLTTTSVVLAQHKEPPEVATIDERPIELPTAPPTTPPTNLSARTAEGETLRTRTSTEPTPEQPPTPDQRSRRPAR